MISLSSHSLLLVIWSQQESEQEEICLKGWVSRVECRDKTLCDIISITVQGTILQKLFVIPLQLDFPHNMPSSLIAWYISKHRCKDRQESQKDLPFVLRVEEKVFTPKIKWHTQGSCVFNVKHNYIYAATVDAFLSSKRSLIDSNILFSHFWTKRIGKSNSDVHSLFVRKMEFLLCFLPVLLMVHQ